MRISDWSADVCSSDLSWMRRSSGSDLAEHEAGQPSCHQRDHDRNQAIQRRVLVGELRQLRLEPDLADEQLRLGAADDLAVRDQIDLHVVLARRDIRREGDFRAEQPVALEFDLARLPVEQPGALLVADERAAEGLDTADRKSTRL